MGTTYRWYHDGAEVREFIKWLIGSDQIDDTVDAALYVVANPFKYYDEHRQYCEGRCATCAGLGSVMLRNIGEEADCEDCEGGRTDVDNETPTRREANA